MPSPFPGMNPYLERPGVSHDFHQSFIPRIAEALAPQIRPDFIAAIDCHEYVQETLGEGIEPFCYPAFSSSSSGGIATAAPVRSIAAPAFGNVKIGVDVIRESFIEIRDRETFEVITVIELLSPTNKTPGSDREQYIGKRKAIYRSNAHLVEIDLLRGGERMPVEGMPPCDYVVMVSRSYERPRVELWPFGLRDPLPLIPIPLRLGKRDATIDLGQLFRDQFDAAGYENYVYRTGPEPPLAAAEAEWAEGVMRQART